MQTLMNQKMRVGHPIPVAIPNHARPVLSAIINGCVGDNDFLGKLPEIKVSFLEESVFLVLLIGNEIPCLNIDKHRRAV